MTRAATGSLSCFPYLHKTTGEIAVVYGQEVLKAVGTYIAEQNFYYEAPDPEGYGQYLLRQLL